MTSARSKDVTHRSREPRIRAIYHFFLFLSILARMRGSRDLCVTPLLLADVILTRTDYIPSHWLRGEGYKTSTKKKESTRLCEKETICFNASPKSYESILKEQKAMKLTFEILIPLSIFKTNRGCISNLYAPRFGKKTLLPQVCKLVPFFQLYRISFRRMILYTQKQRLSGEEGGYHNGNILY